MQNSKLIVLLRSLSREEMKELEKLVESPYFSRGRDCMPLFKILKAYYPKFEKDLTPRAIFEELYPGKKYDASRSDSLISTLSSELYKLCKDFLIQSELDADASQKDLLLLKQLNKRRLYKEYLKEYNKAGHKSISTEDNFLTGYLMNTLHHDHFKNMNDIQGIINSMLKAGENLTALALMKGYLFAGSKHNAKSYNVHAGYSLADSLFESLDSEKLLKTMKDNDDPLYPHIAAHYLAYMCTHNVGNKEYYMRLREILEKHGENFEHSEKHVLYLVLISYLSNLISADAAIDARKGIKKELFEIHSNMFSMDIYRSSPEANLEVAIYVNMLRSAFDQNDLAWAEEFINKASSQLPAEYADGMRDFSLGLLYMKRGEFEKALDKIIHVKFIYNLHKIDLKSLQIKLYYELSHFEQALSSIDATKQYIATTSEITDRYKVQHSNFLKYVSELVKQRINSTNKDPMFTVEKIKEEKTLLSRGWLLKKFEELK